MGDTRTTLRGYREYVTIAQLPPSADLRSLLVTVPHEPRDLGFLRDSAVALLKNYLAASGEQRTPILRQLAEILVESRQHFARADGSPDWTGRSWPYRQFVRELYEDAGVAKTDLNTIQSKARYHISAVLRDFLDEETLLEYGLAFESQRDRSRDRRMARTATLNAFTARDVGGGALMSMTTAFTMLSRVNAEELANLDPTSRAMVEDAAASIIERVHAILNAIK